MGPEAEVAHGARGGRVQRRRDEAVRLAERVAALDAVADAHHGARGLAAVLAERQHQLGREGQPPDRDPGGELLQLGRVDAVAEPQAPEHGRLS